MGVVGRVSAWLGRAQPEARVLVLGLDRSGKSALLAALAHTDAHAAAPAPPAPPAPAPREHSFHSGGVRWRASDVPGGARARALWERHYRGAHAVIFVVDAADHLRLVVAREELQLMLAHADMRARRVPLLVLANKADAPRALPPARVAAALGLERVTDRPWHICATSALSGAGLADGMLWLARQLRDTRR